MPTIPDLLESRSRLTRLRGALAALRDGAIPVPASLLDIEQELASSTMAVLVPCPVCGRGTWVVAEVGDTSGATPDEQACDRCAAVLSRAARSR